MNRSFPARWGSTTSRSVITAVAALICTMNASAQNTSATLRGKVQVKNEPGKTVAGATLTATNNANGFISKTVSAADGSYFLSLEPATYTITVTSADFSKAGKTVRVQIGQALDLNFDLLPISQGSQEVVIIGTMSEIKTAEVATNITTEQIEFLPQGRRSFLDFAALAPGIRLSDDPNAQSFSSGGQTNEKVNIFIDGLSYKNDVIKGGVMGQDSSKGNPFPIGAVQEFRILTENFKAEYQKASAAIITAVTKSGSNEFHGEVYSYYQHKGLLAKNAWDEQNNYPKAAYSRWQQGFSLGGPIIKDKLHFFMSFENVRQDTENNVSLGWRAATAPTEAQALLATLRPKVGTFTSPFRSNLLFGKVDWQINSAQQVEFTVNLRKETDKRDFGGQTSFDRAVDLRVDVNSFTVKHKLVTSNWVNEAMVSNQTFRWNPTTVNEGEGYEYDGLLLVGGNSNTQDIKQDRLSFRDDFTYIGLQGHAIKVGANLDFLSYDVTKKFDFNPTWHLYYGTAQDSTTDWSMPAWTVLRVGNPTVTSNNHQFGWYAQDDWTVSPRLTLNLGLRWDYESDMFNNSYVTPAAQVASLGALVGPNYITDGSKRKADYGAFQPRLGFSYDLTDKGKTIIYGGMGRYYDREAFNNTLDEKFRLQSRLFTFEFTKDPTVTNRILWNTSYFSRAGLLSILDQGRGGSEEAYFLDNGQKAPYSDQFSLGLRHSAGTVNYNVTYTNVQGKNQLTWVRGDMDANYHQVPLPTGISKVLISSTSRTWYEAFYLQVDRPYTEASGWGAGFSYTLSSTEKTGTDLFSMRDTASYDPMKRHKATGSEQNRVVANGIVKVPWGFRLSGLLTLGSGPRYDITDYMVYNDWGKPVIRTAEGAPKRYTFILPHAWAYRSVDLKLQKDINIGKTRLGLNFEGINIFNYANWNYGWESGAIKPHNEYNPRFGQPTGAFAPRRWQFGMTFTF